jgi:hypothetical protein
MGWHGKGNCIEKLIKELCDFFKGKKQYGKEDRF